MPALNVDASIEINAPAQTVRQILVDFHTWPLWSPWLYTEPGTQTQYAGEVGQVGHHFNWSGNKTGAGEMSLTSQSAEQIHYQLKIETPYPSKSAVIFALQTVSEQVTRVNWQMRGGLPFFMFWMKSTLEGVIRSDYRRGLALLKDYVELGATNSNTTLVGISEIDASYYIGIPATSTMDNIAASMDQSFDDLKSASSKNHLAVTGVPFVIYNKMDIKSGCCDYIAALPTDTPLSVSLPLVTGERSGCNALKAIHTGPYRHLGSAWATMMAELKDLSIKPQKNQAPFEIYLNDPTQIQESDLITELYMPVRV